MPKKNGPDYTPTDQFWSGISQWGANAGKNLSNIGQNIANWWASPAQTPNWNAAGAANPTLDEIGGGMYNAPYTNTQLPISSLPADPSIQASPTNGPLLTPNTSGTQGDSYLNLLYSLLKQSQGAGGYGSALRSIANERKAINKNYKENQGDIKTMFGNLTTMRQGDIAGVNALAESSRAASAAQTAAQATQTRDAEAARLNAANQARAALGLGDIAASTSTGDLATQAAEAGLADQGALAQIGRTASEINQNISQQAINDEIARYSTEQDQSLKQLGKSRDAALSNVAGREQQILMQQAQAQQAAKQANIQLQMQIAGLVNDYQAGKLKADTPTGVMGKWLSDYAGNDPAAQTAAATASSAFWNWIQQTDNLMGKDGKPMDAIAAVSAFTKANPENAALLQQTPELNFLLTGIWNTALTKPKAQ